MINNTVIQNIIELSIIRFLRNQLTFFFYFGIYINTSQPDVLLTHSNSRVRIQLLPLLDEISDL